ncbi:MAG: alpha/beta hydrolase [Chitinophagaceae bacterium]|nr:MAG: alpha/beta hydrolase [Chitinophagaceae bacterium]
MNLTGHQTKSTFKNHNGQLIFYRSWKVTGKAKGIVIIVHGLNSHSGYYQNFAIQLCESHFDVYAIDLAGRGESQGERYYIPDYKDIIADIDQLLAIAKFSHPTLPVFIFGHSAGGVFASVYAADNQNKLRGLISESFAFQLPAPAFALAIIKLLGNILPHARLVKLNNADFSRDPGSVNSMNNDPLLSNEKQPAKTMQQLLVAGEYLEKKMPELRLPILIMHGTADKATKVSGSKYFMEHASSKDKQIKLYEGHYHDLLNDKFSGIVVMDILNWLNERI